MIYILKCEEEIPYLPNLSGIGYYYRSVPDNIPDKNNLIYFKRGYFMIDYDKKYEEHIDIDHFYATVFINKSSYQYKVDLVFSNIHKGQATFLKLKIAEFEENNYNILLPELFNSYIVKYNKLIKKYPEHFI